MSKIIKIIKFLLDLTEVTPKKRNWYRKQILSPICKIIGHKFDGEIYYCHRCWSDEAYADHVKETNSPFVEKEYYAYNYMESWLQPTGEKPTKC